MNNSPLAIETQEEFTAYAIRLRDTRRFLQETLDKHHQTFGAVDLPHLYESLQYLRELQLTAASRILDSLEAK